MTAPIVGLRCLACQALTPCTADPYGCPRCGENLEVELDIDRLRATVTRETFEKSRASGHWRFAALLPVDLEKPQEGLAAFVGATRMVSAPRWAAELGLGALWFKDETANPSGSLKDRASSLVVARALGQGRTVVATASTGNAGASLACMGAATGIRTVILVPRTAPRAKVAQLATFGARVILVEASYDTCFDLVARLCATQGWVNRNTGLNPFTREGKKTCSFEISRDLDWQSPDFVAVSVGDGNIISGLGKGFHELAALGLIEKSPRLLGVQSTRSDAISRAHEQAGAAGGAHRVSVQAVQATTRADSISVDLPRDGRGALVALERSQGTCIRVDDEAIVGAIPVLGRRVGLFAEPAASATVAGILEALRMGVIARGSRVVAVITGSGLKDVDAALQAAPESPVVAGTVEAVRAALDGV